MKWTKPQGYSKSKIDFAGKVLVDSQNSEEEKREARELMKKNISFLRTDPFPDAKDYVPFLFNNYCVLEVLGNPQASLEN